MDPNLSLREERAGCCLSGKDKQKGGTVQISKARRTILTVKPMCSCVDRYMAVIQQAVFVLGGRYEMTVRCAMPNYKLLSFFV